MRVLGRGLAQFRFENEAAGRSDLRTGLQPLRNFHLPRCTTAQLHGPRLEAVIGAHEHRGFVLDGLDRSFRYRHVGLTAVGSDQCGDKQSGTPRTLRVFQGDANGGGTGLLAE